MSENSSRELIAAIEAELIALRRELHSHPELGVELPWTRDRVATELTRAGIAFEQVADDGLIACIGPDGGKSIAIRADMDGLPVTEQTGLAFAATNGNMHACGHDGHVTMALGAARVLKQLESELDGRVYVCFQSGEEIAQGAAPILAYLDERGGVDEVVAIHLWAEVPSGQIALQPGPRMAGNSGFRIDVQGVGGHGSRPDLCVDPIKPAAAIVLAISGVPANDVSMLHPAVVHVGSLTAGAAQNVFPPSARILGGYRYFEDGDDTKIEAAIERLAVNIAAAYGATAEVTFFHPLPTMRNAEVAVQHARQVVKDIAGLEACEFEQIGASENFAQYTEKWPGVMGFLGVKRDGVEQAYQHHPRFDLDEDVLALGVEFFVEYARKFLAGELADLARTEYPQPDSNRRCRLERAVS